MIDASVLVGYIINRLMRAKAGRPKAMSLIYALKSHRPKVHTAHNKGPTDVWLRMQTTATVDVCLVLGHLMLRFGGWGGGGEHAQLSHITSRVSRV